MKLAGLSPRYFGAFLKMLAEAGNPPVLLLDEVQNIPHWGVGQDSSRRRYAVVVTGSSSRLTLREVPTELHGRYLSHVPPSPSASS